MWRRARAVQVGLHLQIAGDVAGLAHRGEQRLQRQRRDAAAAARPAGAACVGIRGERRIEMTFGQIGRDRIEPQPAVVQIEVRRDGAVRARRPTSVARCSASHRHRQDAADRTGSACRESPGRSLAGLAAGAAGAGAVRGGTAAGGLASAAEHGVEIDHVGRHLGLHRWPPVLTLAPRCPSPSGSTPEPARSDRSGSAPPPWPPTAARRERRRCRPASRAHCRSCPGRRPVPADRARAAVTSSLSSFSPATVPVRSDAPTCSVSPEISGSAAPVSATCAARLTSCSGGSFAPAETARVRPGPGRSPSA